MDKSQNVEVLMLGKRTLAANDDGKVHGNRKLGQPGKSNWGEYYQFHKERHKKQSRAWYLQNRELVLARTRKRYGLPEPTRPRPDICDCCGRKHSRALAIDHDHLTGKFRGWLCIFCNTGIGKLGDSIEGVKRALLYLEKHSCPEV